MEVLSGAQVVRFFGHTASPPVSALMYLAWSLARQGDFPEALRCAQEAFGIAESADLPYTLSLGCYALGGANLTRGDVAKAIPALERGRELSLTRIHGHRSGFASMLGTAYLYAGRLDEAIPLLEEGARRELLSYVHLESHRLAPLARGYSAAGRHDDALRAIERGLSLARTNGIGYAETWLLLVLAEVTGNCDPPDVRRSLASGAEALTRSLALGTRPMVGHCHLALGRAHWAAGHPSEGEEHIRTAVAMYRQMEMPFWLGLAERAQRTNHA
jgi:tetratricopeptide (TPR) repeat protein